MRFEESVAPTVEPIVVDDVEHHSQIGTIPDDQVRTVSQMITSAREWVENRIHRQLCTATWKLYLESFPDEILIQDKLPIASITSVGYTDSNGDAQTVDSGDYQTDFASPNRPARIKPVYGGVWPTTRDDYHPVTITFTAGYGAAADVPAGIKHAILLLVADWYEHREDIIVGTISSRIETGVEMCLQPFDWGAYS